MIQDVGVTFGRATRFNENTPSSMNLVGWSSTPVWKSATGPCVGNLSKSFTGTLGEPAISEAGRQFLAGLLQQLTDAQIRDLFEVSRVTLRVREPGNAKSGFPTVDEWVAAFKQKRDEIVNRRCAYELLFVSSSARSSFVSATSGFSLGSGGWPVSRSLFSSDTGPLRSASTHPRNRSRAVSKLWTNSRSASGVSGSNASGRRMDPPSE